MLENELVTEEVEVVEDGEEGAALVEYGLLLGLIAVVSIPILLLLGPAIADLFQQVLDALPGG